MASSFLFASLVSVQTLNSYLGSAKDCTIESLVVARMEENTTRPSRPRRSAQATTRRPSLTGHGHHGLMDLSWKDGGSTYPKSSSRVGSKYQATNIPSAGSVEEGSADESSI